MDRIIIIFAMALTITYMVTPLVKKWAIHLGIIDRPTGGRKIHAQPIPYLGGLAIYLGFGIAVVALVGWKDPQVAGILTGGTLLMLLGIADDKRPIPAKWKFIGQILIIALVVQVFDIRIWWLTHPLQGMIYLNGWSFPLSVLWIVAVVNTVNLIDGLDGLAAGVSCIAAATLCLIALKMGQMQVAMMAAALIGSSLAFLRYNFNPARIFMGDSGSMFLGFVLAAISVEGALKSAATIALLVPMLALGFPILDTLFAITRRYRNGRPIYEADRSHLHHRLLDRGMTQKQVVVLLYGFSGLLGLCAVALAFMDGFWPIAVIVLTIAMVYLGARKVHLFDLRQGK